MTKQTTIVVVGSLRVNMFILQTQFRCFISVFSDKSPSKDELTAGKVCLNSPNFVFVYTDFMIFRNTILIC